MATLGETLSNKLINADIDDLVTCDRFYRYNCTKLGEDFKDYAEFCNWYDNFCFEWYVTCKRLAKILRV